MHSFQCATLILLYLTIFGDVFASPKPKAVEREKSENRNSNEDTLIFAHIIFRHGDRNIDRVYPNDPNKDEANWPGGIGELTNVS